MKGFTIYREYHELVTLLSKKEQQELWLAIMEYMFDDKEPKLNDNQIKIFNNLKRPLDKSKNKSKNATKQNQNEIKLKSKSNQKTNQMKSKQQTHQDVTVTVSNYDSNYVVNVDVYSYCEEQFNRTLSSVEYQLISKWQEWFNDDVIKLAIDKTVLNGARGLAYTEAIINSWHDKGFKSLRECQLESNKKSDVKPSWFEKDIRGTEATEEEMKELERQMKL